jgi:hypothetical protein
MSQGRETIRETTVATLSQRSVGVANIFERKLPDESGAVAPRMSAKVSIMSEEAGEDRDETVIAGSVITIGADRYCVVEVQPGAGAPGHITVERLAP